MTKAQIFTAAHKRVKLNYTKKTYRAKFSQALKMVYKILASDKAYNADKKVSDTLKAEFKAAKGAFRVIVKNSPELVVFIESWNKKSIHLVDSKGFDSWNCGTTTGVYNSNDIVKYL